MAADHVNQRSDEPEVKKEDDEDRFAFFRWLHRWYKRYDTWSGRWDWFNRLLSLFKAHTVASVATTGVVAVTAASAVVLVNPDLRQKYAAGWFESTPRQAVKVETQRWGSSVVFPIEGKDLAGKHAAFDVAVLPSDLSWVSKSATALSQGGATISEADVPQRVFTPELREGLERSSGLIAVGLASQEGRIEEEAKRASQRAASAAAWLASVFGDKTPIWTLNLGQFRGGCKATTEAADTGWQRPLIVVGIRSQDDGVNLREAFSDAIGGKSNLPSRDCYTNFDLTRFR